jgi:hypothetical protein
MSSIVPDRLCVNLEETNVDSTVLFLKTKLHVPKKFVEDIQLQTHRKTGYRIPLESFTENCLEVVAAVFPESSEDNALFLADGRQEFYSLSTNISVMKK